ncbi:MAG: hypothetical protein M3Z85_07775 [Acidobacteriota bacterium]|nr:hypothetical protein [Acidobacteriota bacterium]
MPAPALDYLKSAVQPGDSIFSIDNCALAYAPNEDRFECVMLQPATWTEAVAAFSRRPYRFLMVPQAHVADVPAGWTDVYHDAGYHVYRRQVPSR